MKELPLTVKRSLELLGILLLGTVLVIGSDIIMPVIMAFFITIMLVPIYRWLRKYKVPEALAIILPILLVAIFVGLIVWFFSSQVASLVKDFPQIKANVSIHLQALSEWVSKVSHYSTKEQVDFINKKSNDLLSMAGGMASGAAAALEQFRAQVGDQFADVYTRLDGMDAALRIMDRRISRQGAMSMAQSHALTTPQAEDMTAVGVGYGNSEGENAFAVGVRHRFTQAFSLSVSGSKSGDETALGAGASIIW